MLWIAVILYTAFSSDPQQNGSASLLSTGSYYMSRLISWIADIGRVLINVLNNAFDAMIEQKRRLNSRFKGRLVVSTRKDGNQVVIRVSDNGPGIPVPYPWQEQGSDILA